MKRSKLSVESAKQLLAEKMSCLSEEHYFAGWLIGLEYTLWAAVLRFPAPDIFAGKDIQQLKELAEYVNGWWVWDNGEKFISLEDWKKKYDAWKRSVDYRH